MLVTFAIQGVLIGLAGTLCGAALGTLLADNLQRLVAALERLLGTQFLDARVYYMSDLPAYVEGFDVLKVCSVALPAVCSGDHLSGVAGGAHRAGAGAAT